MYVLATMMLLMAIGVSAITAAGFNVGAGVVQRNRTQLEMYSSSMERTLMAALNVPETNGTQLSDGSTLNTLSGKIIYNALVSSELFPDFNASPLPTAPYDQITQGSNIIDSFDIMNIGVTLLAAAVTGVDYTITVTATRETAAGTEIGTLTINVSPYQRYSYKEFFAGYDTDGVTPLPPLVVEELATPLEITISGEITLMQLTTYAAPGGGIAAGGIAANLLTVIETTYKINNVTLIEGNFADNKVDHPLIADMTFNNPSSLTSWWTVIRHELG